MLNYSKEIAKIKINKNGAVISLHKPLLLLLTIADVIHGKINEFKFKEIEEHLKLLLGKYELKNTKALKPEYPFVYLGRSPKVQHGKTITPPTVLLEEGKKLGVG